MEGLLVSAKCKLHVHVHVGVLTIWYYSVLVLLVLQDNRTALMFAAGNGSVEVVKILLDKGADVNIQDKVSLEIRFHTRHVQNV